MDYNYRNVLRYVWSYFYEIVIEFSIQDKSIMRSFFFASVLIGNFLEICIIPRKFELLKEKRLKCWGCA